MDIIRVFFKDLPTSVRGFTVFTFDEGQEVYSIFLNSKLNQETLVKTYEHEKSHIDKRDFESMFSANEIELFRHEQEG